MGASQAPVITLDGPSGAGKGTVSRMLAQRLGWHVLDSGAMYRLLALAAQDAGVDAKDGAGLCVLAAGMTRDIEFRIHPGQELVQVFYRGQEVSARLRREEVGEMASLIAVQGVVRQALLEAQRAFQQAPGLVADGRDMGTVVFPHAFLKVFLTASAEERARRRYKQLKEKGKDVSILNLSREIAERDQRDASRAVAPMQVADDAITLDTTNMTLDQAVMFILRCVEDRRHRLGSNHNG